MAKVKRRQLLTIEVEYEVDTDNDFNEGARNSSFWNNTFKKLGNSEKPTWSEQFTKTPTFTIDNVGPVIERPVED